MTCRKYTVGIRARAEIKIQGTKSQNLEVNGPVSAQEPITGCPQVSFMCPHRRDLPSLVGAVKQALILWREILFLLGHCGKVGFLLLGTYHTAAW